MKDNCFKDMLYKFVFLKRNFPFILMSAFVVAFKKSKQFGEWYGWEHACSLYYGWCSMYKEFEILLEEGNWIKQNCESGLYFAVMKMLFLTRCHIQLLHEEPNVKESYWHPYWIFLWYRWV